MNDGPRPQYDVEAVRSCFTMADLLQREGIALKRQGGRWVSPCPFHEERSASFGTDDQRPHHAHCFGCGWDGSIFDFWMEWREVDFKTALEQLATLGGLTAAVPGVAWRSGTRKMPQAPQVPQKTNEKPALPRLWQLKPAHMEEIAATRGLSIEAVRLAALTYRRAAFCMWPQFQRPDGSWQVSESAVPSWCMTDDTRRCAEFRRLDNKTYPTHSKGEGGQWSVNDEKHWIKAWSTRGKNWPLGAAELGTRKAVCWVKGGPDMLAAYHFLQGFGKLGHVAVVSMLGESARIRDEALPYFAGARVRIFFDADKVQEKRISRRDGSVRVRRTRPGFDAAARWTEQLTGGRAAVKGFSFADMEPDDDGEFRDGDGELVPEYIAQLRQVDGRPVKDLNDLARCNAAVVDHPFIKSAFFDWDF